MQKPKLHSELNLQAGVVFTVHVNCCWLFEESQCPKMSGSVLEENFTPEGKSSLCTCELRCEALGVSSEMFYVEPGHLVSRASSLDYWLSQLN